MNYVDDISPTTVVFASRGHRMIDDYGQGSCRTHYQHLLNIQKAYFIKRIDDRWHHLSKGEQAIAFSLYMAGIKHAHRSGGTLLYAHQAGREKSLV